MKVYSGKRFIELGPFQNSFNAWRLYSLAKWLSDRLSVCGMSQRTTINRVPLSLYTVVTTED